MNRVVTFVIVLLSLLSLNVFSQGFTFTRISPEYVIGSNDTDQIVSFAILQPNSGTQRIVLKRIIEDLTPSWDSLGSSICDYNGCYAAETDSIANLYNAGPGGDDTISIHFYCKSFYAGFLHGAGHVRIRAYIINNPAQYIDVDFRVYTTGAIGIKQISSIVKDFALGQNYPNPFNPATKIDFSIPKSEHVSLRVYDILGREVKILVNQILTPGQYEVDFDAKGLSSGMYYYSLRSGENVSVKKMVLVK